MTGAAPDDPAPDLASGVALGFAPEGAAPPPGLSLLRSGPAALVTAPAGIAATARARLSLCLACHAALPAFLPFAARAGVPVRSALAIAARAGAAVGDRLAAVRGHGEYDISFGLPPEPRGLSAPAGSGREWLDARRRARVAAQEAVAHLEAIAWEMLGDLVADRTRDERGGRVLLALLVPLAAGAELRRRIVAARPPDGSGAARIAATLSGPWPPFSFAALDRGT